MKTLNSVKRNVLFGMILTLVFATEKVWAQVGRLSQQRQIGATVGVRDREITEKVRILRLPSLNKGVLVRTPEFNGNFQNTMPRVTRKPREWGVLEIKYETGTQWTEELAFNYFVITKGKNEEGKDAFSFYTLIVRYVDIPKGNHMSCVVMSPSLIERYGEPISIALEITDKEGKVLDVKSESLIPYPSKEWWKDSAVLDNKSMTRRNGLVDRSKTPFALINGDDYEVVQ